MSAGWRRDNRQRECEIIDQGHERTGGPGLEVDSIPGLVSFFKTFARASSVVAVLVGCAVLAAWSLDVGVLGRFLPGLLAMNPLVALGFVLAGVSAWLLQEGRATGRMRGVARACALVVVLFGMARLLQILFGL